MEEKKVTFGNFQKSAFGIDAIDSQVESIKKRFGKNFLKKEVKEKLETLTTEKKEGEIVIVEGFDAHFVRINNNHKWFMVEGKLLDLFNKLKQAGAKLFTTEKLLKEVWGHFTWAQAHAQNDCEDFLQVALVDGNFKQNLFIDGFINLTASGKVSSFADYSTRIFKRKIKSFDDILSQQSITTLKIENIYGFDEEDLNEIETAKGIIENTRRHSGTYRSELQVAAEAEIKVLITKLRSKTYSIPEVSDLEKVYFISESRLL
ncbi:MAG: hypothetical protein WCJ61_12705, partial [Paludibacter sp.]